MSSSVGASGWGDWPVLLMRHAAREPRPVGPKKWSSSRWALRKIVWIEQNERSRPEPPQHNAFKQRRKAEGIPYVALPTPRASLRHPARHRTGARAAPVRCPRRVGGILLRQAALSALPQEQTLFEAP